MKHSAYSLLELLSTIAVLIALVSVGGHEINRAFDNAQATKCLNNLRQIGIASLAYAADNQGQLPQSSHQGPSRAWTKVLKPYLTADTFRSPLDTTVRACSYAINDFVTENPYGATELNYSRLQTQPAPSQTLYMSVLNPSQQNTDHFHFADPDGGYTPAAFQSEVWVDLVQESGNYLFIDAHIARLRWQDVQITLRQPDSKFIRPDGKN